MCIFPFKHFRAKNILMSTETPDKVAISKRLSKILRHTAHKYPSLSMDNAGFVPLKSLLDLREFRKLSIDVNFVEAMMESDPKTRFTLVRRDGVLYIRANQGHSHAVSERISSEDIYTQIGTETEIPVAIHGTTMNAWETIRTTGLKRMRRSHIHFAPGIVGVDPEVRSGMRQSAPVHIYLDVAKCFAKGIKFYRSANNVILSEGIDGVIPPDCFLKVMDTQTNTVLYP